MEAASGESTWALALPVISLPSLCFQEGRRSDARSRPPFLSWQVGIGAFNTHCSAPSVPGFAGVDLGAGGMGLQHQLFACRHSQFRRNLRRSRHCHCRARQQQRRLQHSCHVLTPLFSTDRSEAFYRVANRDARRCLRLQHQTNTGISYQTRPSGVQIDRSRSRG